MLMMNHCPDGKSFEVMTEELGKMEENYLHYLLENRQNKHTSSVSILFPDKKQPKEKYSFALVKIAESFLNLIYRADQLLLK